jgi:hypothetical protein
VLGHACASVGFTDHKYSVKRTNCPRQLERKIRRLRLKYANFIYERKCALGMHL